MSNATLAGFFIGLAAVVASVLAWRTRRWIELDQRMQIWLDEYYCQEAEYEAITQAELDARVDFAIGYDTRIEPFERFLEGLNGN